MKKIKYFEIAGLILILSVLLFSCEKETHSILSDGAATVKVNLIGVESNTEGIAPGNAAKSAKAASLKESLNKLEAQVEEAEPVQTTTVPFSGNLVVVATLVDEEEHQPAGPSKSSPVLMASTTAAAAAAATPVQKPLEDGVKYKVAVYDKAGAFVDSKTYEYGKEATTTGFVLNAGELYTFVAYSVNSKTTIPETEGTTLSTASVKDVSDYLMYFRKDITLTHGENMLDIVLKHQFSQITTHIALSSTTVGNITSINSTSITPTRSNASIKLSDGAITYGAENTRGAQVIFEGVGSGVRAITSKPTLVIAPATTTGKFSIGAITVNGDTRDVELENLKITPGRRYTLNLEFVVPCTQDVNVDANSLFDWSFADGERDVNDPPTFTVMAPAADYGFVVNLEQVDNSFNMTINGKSLISHATHSSREVQFQTANVDLSVYPQNIQFADGAVWGFNGTPQVYDMRGTRQKPVIRLVISATGEISMYGSKTSGGELYPLVLNKGFYFNNIKWNTAGNNSIKVSQAVVGPTVLKGSGAGKKIVPCTP